MLHPSLHIEPVTETQDIPFGLLELADPSRDHIRAYLATGTCYVARIDGKQVGVFVLNPIDPATMEVKNIAVAEAMQGQGIGTALLSHAERICREAGIQKMVIGTGNSSIGQLALYQKAGFDMCRIERDFFTRNYPEPIVENGIPCRHLVILEKELT